MKSTAWTRFLSLLLALALLMSLAPAVLAAENDPPPAPPDTQEEGTPPGDPPSDQPGEEPGEQPGENPGEEPGEEPGDQPGEEPVDPNHHPFTDVADGKWYSESIQYAYENGLMSGTTATTFDPDGTLTRGMFVTILGRMVGIEKTTSVETKFTDVRATSYYAGYVNWASAWGIVSGVDDTHFAPNAPVTREQMAAIIYRYLTRNRYPLLHKTPLGDYFTDADTISKYASDAVLEAWATGLLSGMGDGKFSPKGQTTRAQAASLFRRLQGYLDSTKQEGSFWVTGTIRDADPLMVQPLLANATVVLCSARGSDYDLQAVSDETGHVQILVPDDFDANELKVTCDGYYDKVTTVNMLILKGVRTINSELAKAPDETLRQAYEAYLKTSAFKNDLDKGPWLNPELEEGFTHAWSGTNLTHTFGDIDCDGTMEMVVSSQDWDSELGHRNAIFTYDAAKQQVVFLGNIANDEELMACREEHLLRSFFDFEDQDPIGKEYSFYELYDGELYLVFFIGLMDTTDPYTGKNIGYLYYIDEDGLHEFSTGVGEWNNRYQEYMEKNWVPTASWDPYNTKH